MSQVLVRDISVLMKVLLGRYPSQSAVVELSSRSIEDNFSIILTSSEFVKNVVRPVSEKKPFVHINKNLEFSRTEISGLLDKLSLKETNKRLNEIKGWQELFVSLILSEEALGLLEKANIPQTRRKVYFDYREQFVAAAAREAAVISSRRAVEQEVKLPVLPSPVTAKPPVVQADKAPTVSVPPEPAKGAEVKVEGSVAEKVPKVEPRAEDKKIPGEKGQVESIRLINDSRRKVMQIEREFLGLIKTLAKVDRANFEKIIGSKEKADSFDREIGNQLNAIKDQLSKSKQILEDNKVPIEVGSLYETTKGLIDVLSFDYPETPYYARLRRAFAGLPSYSVLMQVYNTLTQVDNRRLAQLPLATDDLVSVIMPVFNRPKLIKDAIASVLAQSYANFELIICDDASTDDTVKVIQSFKDKRIRLVRQEKQAGAAAARNKALQASRGNFIAYLDSDNIWHPRFIELMLECLKRSPGNLAAYAGYFDLAMNGTGAATLKKADLKQFHLEDQLEVPFVDLNSFLHSRRLYDTFGGFDERLERRQDYDLISRYCWIREPLALPHVLNIYQRLEAEEQITRTQKSNVDSPKLISSKIASYYEAGLPASIPPWVKKVTVLSWDMSRNHFAKAYCVAEALSKHLEVELISFRFFEEEVFKPLADVKPRFETKYFAGGEFPEFFDNFAKCVEAITGDIIYVVKPRLTSLGIGLLSNYHTGKPLMLECNDLETVVGSAKAKDAHAGKALDDVFDVMGQAKVPHDIIWSQVLDPVVDQLPVVYTHNVNLNIHYRNRCLYMRNIKNDALYDPAIYNRDAVRSELGFKPEDRVILFGGLVRKHKGIFELIGLLEKLNDPRYKLLVVGSRETPDLKKINEQHANNVVILPPQPPERMAAINLASDLVVLWFDPKIPAGLYQSPYKMSDALAMGPAIIASPTSDLGEFARRELVWSAPFGDSDKLVATIKRVLDDAPELERRRKRARAFFQREFSYKSVFPAFALGASALQKDKVYDVSEKFAKFFSNFEAAYRNK